MNLQEALKEIASRNTYYHRDHDLNISIGQMEQAAKLADPLAKTLIWIAYPSGIDCYPEREVFQQDTEGYYGVIYHGKDTQSDLKLAYAVKVLENRDGELSGHLFEIDLRAYAENIRQNAVPSHAVRLYENDPLSGTRETVLPKEEFSRLTIYDVPHMTYWRNEPDNPAALAKLLAAAENERKANSVPQYLSVHISYLQDQRLAFYADQLMQSMNKEPEPDSPDRQNFTATLNYYIAEAFSSEQLSKLLDKLPYQNAMFAVQKGQRDMKLIVPGGEVMQMRRGMSQPNEKPSLMATLKQNAEKSRRQSRPTEPKPTQQKQQKSTPKEAL